MLCCAVYMVCLRVCVQFVAPPKPEEEEAEGTGGTGEGSPKQEL